MGLAFAFVHRLPVHVQRRPDVGMAHQFLLHFDGRPCFVQERPVSVAEGMPADPGYQGRAFSRRLDVILKCRGRTQWKFARLQRAGKNPIFVARELGGPLPAEQDLRERRIQNASVFLLKVYEYFLGQFDLAPNGIAGFVLANWSMSSNQSGEGEIRRKIVEADLVDCMIALPGQLFYGSQIPVCLWFLIPPSPLRLRHRPSPLTGVGAEQL